MRNHDSKFDRYECGEGNTCEWIQGALALGGGLLGYLGSKEQADAQRDAAEMNAEATTPRFYGPGMSYVPGILGDASGLYGQGGFAPPTNPLELLGRENQLGYAEQILPGLVGDAQASWQQGLNPGLNPYVGAMIEAGQNDLTQEYLRNVLPAISNQAQATGGYGGSRQGVAQGIASEGLLEAQGDLEARLLSDAYRQSQQQQQAAWNAAPSMTGLGFMPSQAQQEVGGMYRQDAGQPAANLQGYAGMVNPYISMGQGQAVYSPTASPMQGALGGALAGWGAGSEMGGGLGNWISNAFRSPNVQVNPNQFAGSFDPGGDRMGLYGS